MKNRLIQFLPVLLIAFVSFATLGIVQAQNRNPCADTPEAERLLSELTTACSEQSSEKIEKFIEKWEQESRTATIYDTNDKLTTTVYQLLDYLMEKYYFNNKELSPDKQGRIVNGNLVFPGEVPVYILSDEEYLDFPNGLYTATNHQRVPSLQCASTNSVLKTHSILQKSH